MSMQWRACMYTIRCLINSLPSPQVGLLFGNSICFITKYLRVQLHKFDMTLRIEFMRPEDWERFFIEAGISTDSAKTHTTKFVDKKHTTWGEGGLSIEHLIAYGHVIAWAVTSDCAHTGTSLHGHYSGKCYYYSTTLIMLFNITHLFTHS